VPTRCLGIDTEMVEHGETCETVGLATADIVNAALELVRGRGATGDAPGGD
jgi:hypothetical protein